MLEHPPARSPCYCLGATPKELDDLITIINLPLPDQKELKKLIERIAMNTNSNLNEQDLNELAIASSGLSEIKVKQVMNWLKICLYLVFLKN